LLGGIFLAALLLLAFGHIAEEVIEGDAAKFDQTVMLALRNPSDSSDPLGPAWLEEAARDITGLGSYAVLGFVFCAVVTYLLMTKRRSARPELVAPLARVFTSSFPSGHATLAAVTYLTLGALLASLHSSRRLKFYFIWPGRHPHRRHRPEQGLSWGALPDRRACRVVYRRRLGGTLLDACPLAATTRQDRTGKRRCGRRRRSRQWLNESLPLTPRSI
jgi:hypothetical protein